MTGRIVCVGEVMLDVFAAPSPPDKRHGQAWVRAGGTPVTAALAASTAGGSATVVGRVGDDAAAAAIRSELDRADVEVHFSVDERRPTGTYVEVLETIVAARGANAFLSPADIPEIDAAAVLVSGYTVAHDDTRAAADRALALDARWRAVTAVPLPGFEPPGRANILFANEDEAAELDTTAFEIVVVTRGGEGAYVLRDGRTTYLPPTGRSGTGAGDALAGAFLATLG